MSSLLALNEVVIQKIEFGHTVRLATTIDDERARLTYSADGLIVAHAHRGRPPTTSPPAGPILAPTLRAMVAHARCAATSSSTVASC